MIGEPQFWRAHSLKARIVSATLSPFAAVYDGAQRLRAIATRPRTSPAPVICIGAATLGGVGKTPFALLVAARLAAAGRRPCFLTRGYGGSLKVPSIIDLSVHDASTVGDEALLLAQAAPTVIAQNRPEGAALCGRLGADAIVMDDGYQNPTVRKDCGILLIDAADPAGNGRVFPSGPLREPIARALARADVVVLMGDGPAPQSLSGYAGPVLVARVMPLSPPPAGRVVAFAGIGAPQRFFATLEKSGAAVVARRAFADHHRYSDEEVESLRRLAVNERAALITTTKDFVRLSPANRRDILVFPIALEVDDGAALDALLASACARHAADGARA